MNFANRITLFRIALAPLFLGLFFWQTAHPAELWLLAVLWGLFLVGEASDVLDGWVARRYGQQSDLGKLLDPFADVISRLTVFLCLLMVDIAPLYAFALVMYREISVTFLRLLLVQRGRVLAASSGGKLKAWLYFLASLAGFGQYTWKIAAADSYAAWQPWLFWAVQGLFFLAVVLSVVSFLQYFSGFLRISREKQG